MMRLQRAGRDRSLQARPVGSSIAASALCGLTLCLGLALGRPAARAAAQAGISLAEVRIDVWPEFDRPAALIILDAELEAGVPLPAQITLLIPQAAGQPHAVAVRGADGALLNAAYTTAGAGEWTAVTFTANAAEVRVEYYDPALDLSSADRDYVFRWQTHDPVQAVSLRVQQPFGASGLQTDPPLGSAGTGEYGLSYVVGTLAALPAGGSLALRVTYTKPSATLSADALGLDQAPAATPPAGPAPAPARTDGPTPETVVLIAALVAGTAMIATGAFVILRSQREDSGAAQRVPRSSRGPRPGRRGRQRRAESLPAAEAAAPAGAAAEPPDEQAVAEAPRFCTQCGKALEPSDLFCRNCGAKVRS